MVCGLFEVNFRNFLGSLCVFSPFGEAQKKGEAAQTWFSRPSKPNNSVKNSWTRFRGPDPIWGLHCGLQRKVRRGVWIKIIGLLT